MATRTRDDLGSFDDIKAAAVRTTGLEDFGGSEHEEGLRLLCEDLVAHGGLTPEGNYMQRTFIKSALVGRLLAENGFKEHPSYADVPIERPIFVCGLPRTGTTHLHNLISADPALRSLPYWESIEPVLADSERPAGDEHSRVCWRHGDSRFDGAVIHQDRSTRSELVSSVSIEKAAAVKGFGEQLSPEMTNPHVDSLDLVCHAGRKR